MTHTTAQFEELVRRAREGEQPALGKLLEGYRGYLRVLAEREIGPQLQRRISASDLVQQTFLSAWRNFGEFAGADAGQFLAWLRKIHERNIRDTLRDQVFAQKRAVGREQPLHPGSSADDGHLPDTRSISPSARAMLDEAAVRLARALEKLPDEQREAVRLRHLEGWSLGAIATHLGRSKLAVAALLKRGLAAVRKQLGESE